MNRLITFNINNVLHPLSRQSMQDAAKRWGTEFTEFTVPPTGISHPAKAKLRLEGILSISDQLCVLDADAIVTKNCPNIFREANCFAAVNGLPKTLVNYETLVKEAEEELNLFGYKLEDLPFYFNSGVMLFDKYRCSGTFIAAEILDKSRFSKQLHWWDQSILNIAVGLNENIDKVELDERWNFIPQGRDVSDAYIIHLAGTPNKYELIETYYNQTNL